MCLNIRTPNNHHFSFGTDGKVVVLGVPILKHFRVYVFFPLGWASICILPHSKFSREDKECQEETSKPCERETRGGGGC